MQIWRRRKCSHCNWVFTTTEQPVMDGAFSIKNSKRKKDTQLYASADLLLALITAFAHSTKRQLAIQLFYRLERELFQQAAQQNFILSKDAYHTHIINVVRAYDISASMLYAAQHGIATV